MERVSCLVTIHERNMRSLPSYTRRTHVYIDTREMNKIKTNSNAVVVPFKCMCTEKQQQNQAKPAARVFTVTSTFVHGIYKVFVYNLYQVSMVLPFHWSQRTIELTLHKIILHGYAEQFESKQLFCIKFWIKLFLLEANDVNSVSRLCIVN